MSFDFSLTIRGIQEAQNEMAKTIAHLELPAAARQRIILYATTGAHRYLVAITHVDTGSYRAAQRMQVEGQQGRLYVDPAAVNPRSGQLPVEYSVYEEERGGSHAAYQRTLEEAGPRILDEMRELVAQEILYGR
jgi:hypothetical protein